MKVLFDINGNVEIILTRDNSREFTRICFAMKNGHKNYEVPMYLILQFIIISFEYVKE